MATSKQQLDILSPTMSLDPANDGSFVRNMENRQGSWAVRPGFGLLYRGDTTMSLTSTSQGYKRHLGSRIIKTAFGHTQIVTVLSADVFTGESREVGTYSSVYSVSIFDVEDNTRVEHILHSVTGDGGRSFHEARVLKACYEEASDRTAAKWRLSDAKTVAFQELAGNLYFSNEDIGVYVYRPALVVERSAQVQGADEYDWSPARGESSSVTPVVFSDGLNTEAFNYISNNDLSGVSAMCEHQGSLVYASGNTIFYSDAYLPNNIKAANSDIIPVLSNITAMASNGELIYVYSRDETWVIQPSLSQTGLLAGGVLTRVSAEVGCVAPSAIMSIRNVPMWISEQGVHAINSNFGYQTISEPIQEYWREGVSDPFSHYATQAGATNLGNQQPETFSAPPIDPMIGYNERFDEIYCSFDDKVWVFSKGTWLVWDFESYYSSLINPKVTAYDLVNGCQVLSMLGQTYMVAVDNPLTEAGLVAGQSRTVFPYSIYELGRGGGKDNSYVNEQDLIVSNEMEKIATGTPVGSGGGGAAFYFELTEINAAGEYVFLLSGVPPSGAGVSIPDGWTFRISFNSTYWEPVDNVANLDYQLPNERIGSLSAITNADRSDVAGAASINGDCINIEVVGVQYLNERYKNPLMYVRFKPTAANSGTNTFGWSFPAGCVATINIGGGGNVNASVFVNDLSYAPQAISEGFGQSVAYLYKAPTARPGENQQIRTRGLYTRVTSHGEGATLTKQNYPYRLYNAAFGSDKKLYNDQVIYSASEVVTLPKETSIRTRIQKAGVMVDKTFNGEAYYADPANAATGNLLIDNQQVDEIAMSTSARGGSIGVMLFGFILNKAEAIRLYAAKMTYKVVGGARRRGR